MSLDELSTEQRNAVEEWRELVLKLLAAETQLFEKRHPDIELTWELTIDPTTRHEPRKEKP